MAASPPAVLASSKNPPPVALNEGDQALEVDDQAYEEDGDSTFESIVTGLTGSVTSSVLDYAFEHGRRYHSDRSGNYALPNDEAERERLDMMHMLLQRTLNGKLFLAPVEMDQIHRVLDIGTGTGAWAIDIGDQYPNLEVWGNDISVIQPDFVPVNVHFEYDDVEKEWTYLHKFDFIFSRYMIASILDWPKLVANIYDNLAPGGWAEFQDYDLMPVSDDGTVKPTDDAVEWSRLFIKACKQIKREPCPGPELERWVKDAGFINVTHRKFKIPYNSWPKDPHLKEIGRFMLANTLDGLHGFSVRPLCDVLGWTEEEVLVLLVGVRKQLLDWKNWHGYLEYHVVYGQKPL